MGKFAGFVMIVAGVGTAAYVYPLMGTGSDRAERQASDVAAIATSGALAKTDTSIIRVQPAPNAGGANKAATRIINSEAASGKAGLVPTSPLVTGALTASTASVIAQATSPVISPSPVPPPSNAMAPQLVGRAVDAPVPQPVKRTASSGVNDEARANLTRDIQRELKRVGCYAGDTDGTWNTATRQAMKAFNERVNATLPVEDPDHILKTLVQGHPGNACGKSCPAGQSAVSDGRCMPTAIMAQRPAVNPAVNPAANRVNKAEPVPMPAQIVTAAPVATPPAPSVSSWETKVTAAPILPPARAPAIAAVQPPAMINMPRADLPPGRMSVGAPDAPKAEPTVAQTVAKDDALSDSRNRKSAPKIVVKPKPRNDNEIVSAPTVQPANPVAAAVANTGVDVNNKGLPKFGAIAASEPEDVRPVFKPQGVERQEIQRQVERRPPPPQRVVAYVPPPRYVGAYNAPPVYRERARFGPQIFRQLDANGR